MRQLLLVVAIIAALVASARAAESKILTTNVLSLGEHGTLQIPAPKNWSFAQTNMHLPGDPPSVELHSPGNTASLRLTVYWDGFPGKISKPTDADMDQIV